MSSFRLFDRRVGILAAAFALLISAVLPVLASAAQVTTRSIELSSSVADASGVTYKINFTPETAGAGAFIVDFCSDTPLIGESCAVPGGFSVENATGTNVSDLASNTLLVNSALTADTPFSVEVANVHNPTAAGPLYARIVSYVDNTVASAYVATTPGAYIDDGSMALSITNGIAVGGSVLESLTFCVSSTAITGVGCSAGVNTPTLELGETTGSVKALSANKISTGDIYTQVSSNAASGVVINLKNNRTCGGLARVETPTVCEIMPSTGVSDFANVDEDAGVAKFGVKVAADTTTDSTLSATGTLQAVAGSNYSGSAFHLNWVNGNATGVSSIYGDPILDTLNTTPDPDVQTQPSNKNMKLTFGASISPDTPAGRYFAELSLIATGKF
ncbi:MAG: hypothetical protein ACSLEY_00420 [Candidatus Saccharimonadales bacterium]